MRRASLSKQDGFTLIEIMIVIMILAMLVSVAIPAMLSARDKSASRVCRENLRNITHAKQRWGMDNNQPGTATATWSDIVPVYLKGQMPTCPSGGTYTLGTIDENATCSMGGEHSFQ